MTLRSRRPAVARDEPIAIVGASCRFPGADGLKAFWELLATGADAVGEVDSARWATRFFYHPERTEPGKSYTWAAGLIENIDQFEPSFFGISPREAVQMDPQQRLLLELTWHAFEDAGIAPSRMRGRDAGVYIGASATDYPDLSLGDPAAGDSYFMTGNALSILANRISYIFDLRGPSLAIDTACSSSLVALHHACEAIRGGQVSSAIVGGVNLLLTPYAFLGFSRASMLSRRGRCFSFDARADGYVRAEGAGVIIVKPLSRALADHDPVRAVILATGCNSDGRTIGLSLPSEAAQAALLAEIYREAGIAADDLAFFEMHGTGTPVGDPVEAAAVGRTIAIRRHEPLPIGSVKTNIGHLEAASGMGGLLKVVLALEEGLLPPTIHCENPNPNIDFSALNLRLVRSPEPIDLARDRRVAGVNSFGFGGANAHAVLAAAPDPAPLAFCPRQPPLVISAATRSSLGELAAGWRNLLPQTPAPELPRLLRAAARGREHQRHRLAASVADPATAAQLLGRFVANEPAPGLITGVAVDGARLAFVFSGNGAQFPGMGRTVPGANADFRAAVAEVDQILRPDLGWSVLERIEAGIDAGDVARADAAQPVLFAVQVGIVAALRAQGIVAEGHLGHSVGEITAAWASGALALQDAAHVVVARSRCQQRTKGAGRMAALALGQEAARKFLDEIGSGAAVAALNATRSVTVSGTGDEIVHLAAKARDRGLWCRPLDLDFAFHSHAMEPVRDELRGSLADLSWRPPSARLASTVTGAVIENDPLDVEHWWRNIRDPVRFAEAASALIAEGFRIFVEIGPGPILHSYLTDALRAADAEGRVLASLTRNAGDADPFPAIASQCYVAGYDWPATPAFDGDFDPHGLPLYRWERQRYWLPKTVESADFQDPPFDHPLLGFRQRGYLPAWLNHLDAKVLPWVAHHAVEGAPVFPAAAVIETALAAAKWRWPEASVLELADVEIRRPVAFELGRMREMRLALTSEDGDWELVSRPRLSNEPLNLHAVGRIAAADHEVAEAGWADAAATGEIDGSTLYRLAARMGLEYGGAFRTVDRVEMFGPDRAIVHLDPSAIDGPLSGYLVHPALFDGALQGFLALLANSGHAAADECFLPWRFARVRLAAPFARLVRCARLHLTRVGVRSASADLRLYDEADDLVAEVIGCWFRRVELRRRGGGDERLFYVDLVRAPLAEREAPALLATAGSDLARLARSQAPDPKWRETGSLIDAMIGAASLQQWQTLAIPGREFTVAELVDESRIAPASAALADCLLRALESVGGAAEADGIWQIEAETDLPEAAEVWRLLLADNPELGGELALLGAAFDKFSDLLADGPVGSAPSIFVETLFQGSPAVAAGIEFLGEALGSIAAQWPVDRPLRILEIGADGYATRRFLHALAKFRGAVTYLVASEDPEQADRLDAMTKPFAGTAACQWAPVDGIAAIEAIGQRHFDIVIAVHACTRLKLDATSLAGLREVIRPGGLFLAVEPEPNRVWDLIFGQRADWWLDGNSDAVVSPLQSGTQWRAKFAAAGFRGTGAASLPTGPWPAAAIWASAPPCAEPMPAERPASRTFAVIGDDCPLRRVLADRLSGAGHRIFAVETSDGQSALRQIGDEDGSSSGIVFIAGEDTGAAARQIAELARVARAAAERRAPLWVVTHAAQQKAADSAQAGLAGAGVWSFARVLANELSPLSVRLIDIAATGDFDLQARRIADEIAATSPETEVVWSAEGRHVMRLRSGLPPRPEPAERPLTLTAGTMGGLQSLGWSVSPTRSPGRGEVEIEVRAGGLNFRDVMWAMGLLPEEALIDGFAGPSFGLECAGFVRAVGPEVKGLAVGDRVMGFAPSALATRALTLAEAVVPIPAEVGFGAAATLPVAFVTVVYALGRLAKLGPGEYVLIHAAAGGVGLAAIQYAKHCGAIVIATAGSPIKRRFLQLAGADHVLDSRDLGFADGVRALTQGAGVDVVLNSLSGEAMERSIEVLKPFGRFLELGKRDYYFNRRLHMRPLRHNVSYFALDIDQLPRHRPALARSLLLEVSMLLREGAIRPLAHRSFRYSQVDDAFRLMQASGHIGKLVLVPDPEGELPVREPPAFSARRDGTYLVTGGVDGFGFAAARWLAAQGAGMLVLVGRRGVQTPGCEERVAELKAAGAEVRVYAADVADRVSLAAVLREIRAGLPPLRGVVHAASAIDDRLTSDIEVVGIDDVLRPKLDGALALDELTRDDPIELFLLFSSATTLLGAPGQGAYVAANMALEALARRRHAEGRPALAVAWGPIEDAGYLAERPEMREALARRLGAVPLPAAQALAALPAMLASGLPTVAFAAANWSAARRILPILATPLFSELHSNNDASGGDEALADRLLRLDPGEAQALLQSVVGEEVGRILRLPAGGIDLMRPLSELGMDSLMAVELRLALESRLQLDLPLMALAEGTSVASIATRLSNALATGAQDAEAQDAELVALAVRHEAVGATADRPHAVTTAEMAAPRTAAE